eukprot:323467-Chlamydomonas_euryale.AAC.1
MPLPSTGACACRLARPSTPHALCSSARCRAKASWFSTWRCLARMSARTLSMVVTFSGADVMAALGVSVGGVAACTAAWLAVQRFPSC